MWVVGVVRGSGGAWTNPDCRKESTPCPATNVIATEEKPAVTGQQGEYVVRWRVFRWFECQIANCVHQRLVKVDLIGPA